MFNRMPPELKAFFSTHLVRGGPWRVRPSAQEVKALREEIQTYERRWHWLYQSFAGRFEDLKSRVLSRSLQLLEDPDPALQSEAFLNLRWLGKDEDYRAHLPLWNALLQSPRSEIREQAAFALLKAGTESAIEMLAASILDSVSASGSGIVWRLGSPTFYHCNTEPLKAKIIQHLAVAPSAHLLYMTRHFLPSYSAYFSYQRRYRGSLDEDWDRVVSGWLSRQDDNSQNPQLFRIVAGHFSRHAIAVWLQKHQPLWNRWLYEPDPACHKVAIRALGQILEESEAHDVVDALTSALFSEPPLPWRARIMSILAKHDYTGKPALWQRLLSSWDDEIRRMAQHWHLQFLGSELPGRDLDYWESLWLRGETDALRLRGACVLFSMGRADVFIWLIERMEYAHGGELKQIWEALVSRQHRHTALYAAELLKRPRRREQIEIRRAAARALKHLAPAPEAYDALVTAMSDSDLDLQLAAAASLATYPAPELELVPWCARMFQASEVRAIMMAIRLTDRLKLVQFAPTLAALASHPNPRVQSRVRRALRKTVFQDALAAKDQA